jgi:hypothetical protein
MKQRIVQQAIINNNESMQNSILAFCILVTRTIGIKRELFSRVICKSVRFLKAFLQYIGSMQYRHLPEKWLEMIPAAVLHCTFGNWFSIIICRKNKRF